MQWHINTHNCKNIKYQELSGFRLQLMTQPARFYVNAVYTEVDTLWIDSQYCEHIPWRYKIAGKMSLLVEIRLLPNYYLWIVSSFEVLLHFNTWLILMRKYIAKGKCSNFPFTIPSAKPILLHVIFQQPFIFVPNVFASGWFYFFKTMYLFSKWYILTDNRYFSYSIWWCNGHNPHLRLS